MCCVCATAGAQALAGWNLIWSDEFSGAANTPPDPSKWGYDLGDGGWGNSELETYTNSTLNSFQDGLGHLVIEAVNTNGNYTSARLKTQNSTNPFTFLYGRVDASIKLPYAQGTWPAFWMLGSRFPTVAWPLCGEIDLAENFGVQDNDASTNHGTIHGPNYAGTGVTATYTLPGNQLISAGYHVFSMQWAPGSIQLSVDGNAYLNATPASLPAGGTWVFDNNPMFLLLNLAVGGSPAPVGAPDAAEFPQQMLVDYVRVYQAASIPPASYLVGDVAPYTSDWAPQFGDGSLNILDLVQELFAVNSVPGFRPAACSDRFDAMDLYPADTPSARGGDGMLDVRDLVVELFRVNNLDPARPVRPSLGGICATASSGSSTSGAPASRNSALPFTPRQPIQGVLVLGDAERASEASERIPVYLEARQDLVRLALTFALGDQRSQLRFIPNPAALPSLAEGSEAGVVAAAWLAGVSIPAGERLLMGYVEGPAGSRANLKAYGISATNLDDDRDVRLAAAVTGMEPDEK
jgi:beta-glucanase (GH16 family)